MADNTTTQTQAPTAATPLDTIAQQGKLALNPDQMDYARQLIAEYVTELAAQGDSKPADPFSFITSRINALDGQLSAQLDEILHQPAFQKLEASWRGMWYLVSKTETGAMLKLRLLNCTKKELSDDLEKAIGFDQSALFRKVYEEEYGTFGGAPYSCLVGDFDFSCYAPDVTLLEKIASVAAAAHAPFIAAAAPEMFGMDSFTNLGKPRDLAKLFESTDKVQFDAFRDTEDSRYVTLTLPRVLMRLPYGPMTLPVDGINYTEVVDGATQNTFCWGNPAYMMAQRITDAFTMYGWTAAIRGTEGGGMVEDLPAYTFKTTDGDLALKCPTEIAITDRREKELSDLGFLSLCHCKNTNYAVFFGAQTVQKPKVYNTADANANANLSARVTYLLAASRFAHYIKVIMRDKVGTFMTKTNVQKYLQTWISNYVLLNDNASQDLKAQYPLREARVDVFEVPGNPGQYKATVFLRPHFQLEGLTASIRLVAKLPPPAAG